MERCEASLWLRMSSSGAKAQRLKQAQDMCLVVIV